MLRNRELLGLVILQGSVALIAAAIGFSLSPQAGWLALALGVLLLASNLAYTWRRYQAMAGLANELRRVAQGDYRLNLEAYREGELSILEDELGKVTMALREQAGLLAKDKRFLADSLSDISHQLRTPLTSLGVMADLLRQPDLPQDKRVECLRTVQTQVDRLQWLVSNLLKLSQLDAGAIEFNKGILDSQLLIERALEPLQIPLEIQDVSVTHAGKADLLVDGAWAAEAFGNLFKNALEHSPPGSTIHVLTQESPIYTEIRIQDEGEGIDAEDLPRLFQRFYRGKNSKPGSIGIGLALAQSILKAQNASISVESTPGQGTTFIVRFYKQIV